MSWENIIMLITVLTLGLVAFFVIWEIFFRFCSPTPMVTSENFEIRGEEAIKNFFEKINVRYTDKMELRNNLFQELATFMKSFLYPFTYTSAEAYNNFLENKKAKVYIKWINRKIGYGVFADQDINAGDFIMNCGGVLAFAISKYKTPFSFPYVVHRGYRPYGPSYIDSGFCILSNNAGNESRFINDNPDVPESINVSYEISFRYRNEKELIGCYEIPICATKDIKKGQQLILAYDPFCWFGKEYVKMPKQFL